MNKPFNPQYRNVEVGRDIGLKNDENSRIFRPTSLIERRLYLSRTSGVNKEEFWAARNGIERIIAEVRSDLKVFDLGLLGSAEWCQEYAGFYADNDTKRKIDAVEAQTLLTQIPQHQFLPMNVLLFDEDIVTEKTKPPVNGVAYYRNILMSVKPFRTSYFNQGLNLSAIKMLAAHELGHNFGLAGGREHNWVEEGGRHCNGECGPCLMEQVNGPRLKRIEQWINLIINRTRWLCEDCINECNVKKWETNEAGMVW